MQRVGDEMELSWGDRIQPGAQDAEFIMEDGVARAPVDAVATSLSSAIEWFLEQQQPNSANWVHELEICWTKTGRTSAGNRGPGPEEPRGDSGA